MDSIQSLSDKKILGIIGGLGPMATAHFMELIINMTNAATDQDHIPMIIYNLPYISDRTRHILGQSDDDPSIPMTEAGEKLISDGVSEIAIPCVTASFYHEKLSASLPVPVLNGIMETGEYLSEKNIDSVGVMATDGTIQSRLFERVFDSLSIKCITPDEARQKKVMHLIYDNVKAGRPIDTDAFWEVVDFLRDKGAKRILLGCTELSVIKKTYPVPAICLDVMEVMARKCVLDMGHGLKEEFDIL